MARRKQTKGLCAFCSTEIGKGTVARHLAACAPYQDAVTNAQNSKAEEQTLYHLRVQDAYDGSFWLDLEMSGSASLKTLDIYLRAIWLECCGHLSEFTEGKGGWGNAKVGMARKASDVFAPDIVLTHIYDFGTSSETQVKVISARQGQPMTKKPLALLVRNVMPEVACMKCAATATHMCLECQIEDEESGFLCDAHLKKHPHGDNYGEPTKLVNSPRLGMCGYDGPAEPPY